MSSSLEKGVFQPNFVTFTNTDIIDRDSIAGKVFRGNQNNGFCYVTFADGSGGVEKRMKHWTGNKTGRFYRGELLAAQEYLAAQVGKIMNAPIRDCAFTNTDAQTIIMPFIDGETGAEKGIDDTPNNEQGVALRLFDYLTANSDRRPKNLIFADNGNIVGIDHALCNFRPRQPKPEFVSELWNGGVTLENLQILKPKLMVLGGLFHQFGMDEQFGNLMSNLDRLIGAFEKVSAVIVAKTAFEAQTPPQGVQEAAKRALEWMADGKAGRNFTGVGRKRASDLAHGHPVSLETLKRMKAYFDRHGVDKETPHWNEPSPGKVAWYAWGGDAGYSWAKTMVARAEKASEAVSKAFEIEDKIAAKLRDADSKADEAMNLRRNEKWESAHFAHKEAARLYNAAASMIGGDDDGHLTAARGKASSQDHLADEAKFQGDTGERHSPAEMDEPNPPTNIVKGDSEGHPFRGNQYAQGVVNDLDNGVSPEIALHELPGLVKGIHDLGPRDTGYDITNLTVDGEKPFQTTGDDQRLREHMPQILPSQRDEFLKDIQEKYGITAKNEEVDPKTLKPSQNEIDGWKTGGVFKEFGETGVPEKRAPLVSRDGYIIDGHHYWSAALAMRAENPNYKLPIRRLDCDITTALHIANEWHDEVGNERLSIGHISKAGVKGQSGDKDGHDFRGNQWWMMGPDGVPIPRPRPDKSAPTGDGSQTPAAPKTPKPRTPRTPKPTEGAEKTYAPQQTPIKWGKGVVPEGWKLQKQGNNKAIYVSDKGNTAVLSVRARGWKIGDRYTNTVMTLMDKWATGKKIDFATERKVDYQTLAFVAQGDPNTIGMGKHSVVSQDKERNWDRYQAGRGIADPAEKAAAIQEWKDLTDKAKAGDQKATDQVEQTLMKADDLAPKKLDKLGKSWSMGSVFLSSQRSLEADLVHELGHSTFFATGSKISQMFGNLNKLLPTPHDWQKGQETGQRAFLNSQRRYAGVNYGGGVIVLRHQLADYVKDSDSGSYELSTTESRILRSIGATEYGSKKLQELVAESYAAFQMPNIPDSPLTKAVAASFGWTKVQDGVSKSATIPTMETPIGPQAGSNEYIDADGNLIAFYLPLDTIDGPKDVLGNHILNGDDSDLVGPDEE